MPMCKQGVIIGTFVKKHKILSFLEFLKNKIRVDIEKVFIFNVEDNSGEYLVTFSSVKNNPHFKELHDATILHTKNGCLFSINALNKYIELFKKKEVKHKNFEVDWSELKNKLLITTNGILKINQLFKIEDKTKLFKI